jgi:hypothetical protein
MVNKTNCTKWTICDKIPFHTDKSRYLEKLSENDRFSHVNKQKLSHLLGLIDYFLLLNLQQAIFHDKNKLNNI